MMKKILLVVLCMVGCAGVSYAGCTQEELQGKAMEFSTKVSQLAQKNPQKYAEVAQAMQTQLPELQKNAADIDKLCAFYDEWIAKMK
jgi:hypothetical protein